MFFILVSCSLLFSSEFVVINEIEEIKNYQYSININEPEVSDKGDDQIGLLIVESDIKNLHIDSAYRVKQEYTKGNYFVYLRPGINFIEFKKEGFDNLAYNLRNNIGEIKSGSVYKMSVEKKNNDDDSTGWKQQVIIESNPINATVLLDSINVGKTPLELELQSGKYDFEIKKVGYISANFLQYSITNNSSSISTDLIENIGYLDLNIKQQNAKVLIDNEEIEFNNNKSIKLQPKSYSIKVIAEGYVSEEISILIALQKEKKISVDLHKNIAYFEPYIYPHDSEFYIDNELVSSNKLLLKPGSYKVKVQKTGFISISDSIHLSLDENLHKDYLLKRKFVNFSLTSNIENSVYRVYENNTLISEWTGNRTFSQFPIGNYLISCDADNYSMRFNYFELQSDFDYSFVLKQGSDVSENMAYIHGGTFKMGNNRGGPDEKPAHNVTVDDFFIGKYEVTQLEWREIMRTNPSKWQGDNLPVGGVSWYDAVEFCNAKSLAENLEPCYIIDKSINNPDKKNKWIIKTDFNKNGYRLPTEAEWEYAARGGVKNHNRESLRFAGSGYIDEVAWYLKNSKQKTHPVGKKKPNELGIYDMTGNVWEWCNDWYDKKYYKNIWENNPKGPVSGMFGVTRGNSIYSGYYFSITSRLRSSRNNCGNDNGLRLVRGVLK